MTQLLCDIFNIPNIVCSRLSPRVNTDFPFCNFDQTLWWLSWKARNSLLHALNGNPPSKTKKGKRAKAFTTSAFEVSDKTELSRVLSKLCGREVSWISEEHSDRLNCQVIWIVKMYAFWWRATKKASFSGKGAGAAKRWVLQELEKGHEPKEFNQLEMKESCLPSKREAGQRRDCDVKRKETKKSSRIQSILHTQATGTKEQMVCHCVACHLAISHNFEEHEVVKCTKCANMFHPAC